MSNDTILIPIRNKRGEILAHAIIDAEDYDLVSQYSWWLKEGYATTSFSSGKKLRLHRLLMQPQPDEGIDHINHNKLDNRRCNLRIATQAQNNYNTPMKKANTSGYRGVSWHAQNKTWRARIGVNNKEVHLGCFSTPEEAALVRDEAAKRLHGEFASLNFEEQ